MANLPYITAPGNIDKALNGIKAAADPQKVSQDFVKTILKIPGGSGDQMTSFIKKLGLTNPDGSPNDTYRKFRNPGSSGTAIATAIRHAYAPLFVRNEFMHRLDNSELVGLIIEETGQSHDSSAVKLTASCIDHLKSFADFDEAPKADEAVSADNTFDPQNNPAVQLPNNMPSQDVGLNLGYTINLNLPATSDPAVFDAIFKSLKANLLGNH
ncbi:MAG: hypothetical protein GKS01_14815 [Alphaproteobacteria bacterium]|nr:hypothetical protein [Alphaproteobacteria bacterium]